MCDNKTIVGFSFLMTARFLKASVCVIRLIRRLRQIIQTSALIILAVMLNLIQQLLIASLLHVGKVELFIGEQNHDGNDERW